MTRRVDLNIPRFRGLLIPAPGTPLMRKLPLFRSVSGTIGKTLYHFLLFFGEFSPIFHPPVVATEALTPGGHFNIPSV